MNYNAILTELTNKQKEIFFIQIGANDGKMVDPLQNFVVLENWKGLMFEPIKDIYEQLVENHKKTKDVIFVNSAIHTKSGNCDMYRIPLDVIQTKKFNETIKGCNTFYEYKQNDSSTIPMKIFLEKFRDYVITESVVCMTMHEVIEKYKIKTIDVLQIDAEGSEYSLITTFPFDIIKPKIICYETAENKQVFSKDQIEEMKNKLQTNGYTVNSTQYDTLAVLS